MSRVTRTEVKVVLLVLAGLGLLEVGMRGIEARLSKDVAHLRAFPEIAESLEDETAPTDLKVLFLGNSLTRHGVAPEVFREEVGSQGVAIATACVHPDNTALADWYYAYLNFFEREDRLPDVLIIGFEGGHLRDAPTRHPNRLARYYDCRTDNRDDLVRFDLPTFEDRAAFLLAGHSAMYSNRDRIERRVLDLLIPGYRDGIQQLNHYQVSETERRAPTPQYDRLRKLIEHTKRAGVDLILAAMPIADPYQLDAELLEVVAETGTRLIDCRNVPGMVPDMFPDGIHMTAEASQIYSSYLAHQLPWRTLAERHARRERQLADAAPRLRQSTDAARPIRQTR